MPKRLLIVEDLDNWANAYEVMFGGDYDVSCVSSHAEALGALEREGRFDAAILDLELLCEQPNRDGVLLLEPFNERKIPVIVVSAHLVPALNTWIHRQYPWVYRMQPRQGIKADRLTELVEEAVIWKPRVIFNVLGREEREQQAERLIRGLLKAEREGEAAPTRMPATVVIDNTGGVIGGPVIAGNAVGGDMNVDLSPADSQALGDFARLIRERGVPGLDGNAVATGAAHLEEMAEAGSAGTPLAGSVSKWRKWIRALAPPARVGLAVLADACTVLGKPLLQLLGLG